MLDFVILNQRAALEVGIDGAVLLQNFRWWRDKCAATGENFHDGKTWVYHSAAALAELFPIYSLSTIKRTLARLVKEGYLEAGRRSENSWDRTYWYAVTEKADALFCEPSHGVKVSHARVQPDTVHGVKVSHAQPDLEPSHGVKSSRALYIGKNKEEEIKKEGGEKKSAPKRASSSLSTQIPEDVPADLWGDWLTLRKEKRAPVTGTVVAQFRHVAEQCGISFADLLRIAIRENWRGVKVPWVQRVLADDKAPAKTKATANRTNAAFQNPEDYLDF